MEFSLGDKNISEFNYMDKQSLVKIDPKINVRMVTFLNVTLAINYLMQYSYVLQCIYCQYCVMHSLTTITLIMYVCIYKYNVY